jgi:Protein kinase domain/PEGA domain/Putative zinc-finger
MGSGMACVGDNTLVQFVEGRLAGDRLSQVEDHLAACSSCRALVSELGRSSVVPMPAAPAGPSLFTAGDRIAARWEVTRFIAAGGMGEVYEVLDRELGTRMALKTMRPELAVEPRALDRFKREIHLARKVTHPNVCRIFDFGVHTMDNASQVPFLTMELLDGPTLADHLARMGRLAPEVALPLVDQLTAALEAAHQAGVVHRDFKPQNIVIVDTRQSGLKAVVTDFGVARAFDGDDLAATKTGARGLVGSPAYMAPEQVEGRPAGPPADLYGLGVVLFELVTGTLPFEGESPLMTALLRLERPPPSPRSRVADLDERWERIILRCLARDAAERPSSPREVFLALSSGARRGPSRTVPPTWAGSERRAAPAASRRWPWAIALTLCVTAVVTITALVRQTAALRAAESSVAPPAPVVEPAQPPAAQPVKPAAADPRVSVILRSEPPGAVVRVDDRPVATTPAVVPLLLPHEVTLTLEGYLTARELVQNGGEVTVHLQRARAPKKEKPENLRLLNE